MAMLRMHRQGLLQLPPPRNPKGGSGPIKHTFCSAPQPLLSRPVHELSGLHLEPVLSRPDSTLWNEYIDPLPLSGIQAPAGCSAALLRLFRKPHPGPARLWRRRLENRPSRPLHRLASFGKGEKPSTDRQQRPFLDPSLGPSPRTWPPKVLAMAARQLPEDWHDRYAYRPVLLETFVDHGALHRRLLQRPPTGSLSATPRAGASWTRDHKADLPTKSIWLYPTEQTLPKFAALNLSSQTRLTPLGIKPIDGFTEYLRSEVNIR